MICQHSNTPLLQHLIYWYATDIPITNSLQNKLVHFEYGKAYGKDDEADDNAHDQDH